jgi:hypothetical protein
LDRGKAAYGTERILDRRKAGYGAERLLNIA